MLIDLIFTDLPERSGPPVGDQAETGHRDGTVRGIRPHGFITFKNPEARGVAGFGNSRTSISVIPGQFRECSDTVDHRLRCHVILPVLNKAGRDRAETEASEAHDCARHTIHTATDGNR